MGMMRGVSTGREPIVLLAFADTSQAQPLRNLTREQKAIRDALEPSVRDGKLAEPNTLWNATVDGIVDELRKERFRGRFRVFHFGGHANGSAVIVADDEGAAATGHATGLADYLGKQEGLALVVLNGCCTGAQVTRLRAAGVGAVVATTRAIMDDVAADFATHFYAELVTEPLKVAFERASAAVRTKRGENPRELVNETIWNVEEWDGPWPWVLSCALELEGWRLVSRPKYDLRRVVEVLAHLLSEPGTADLVAKRAGFPVVLLPRFTNAFEYWSVVVETADKGTFAGGIQALLEEATRMFPYSPKLAELRV
jgi:hypothetical protein